MKRAFSLVELMIVVALLGIVAAIALPTFQDHLAKAKEAAAKDNLRVLRNAIERYAAQHDGVPPGYPNDDPSNGASLSGLTVYKQMVVDSDYLSEMPENPFNEDTTIEMVADSESFPTEPVGFRGWIYKPATKTIKLNWPGTDSEGVRYFDY